MTEGQRNIAIVIVVGILVSLFVGLQLALALLFKILGIVFFVLMAMWFWQMYKKNEASINRMDLAPRLVLMGSGVGMLLVVFTGSVWPAWGNGAMSVLFFGLIALCALGMWWGWQQRKGW